MIKIDKIAKTIDTVHTHTPDCRSKQLKDENNTEIKNK